MKIIKKFEENLEYLGFDMAPIAWDLARFPFESDDDRIALLEELTQPAGGMTSGGTPTDGLVDMEQPNTPNIPTEPLF